MPVLHAGRAVAAQRAATASTSCSSSRTAEGAELVLAMTARGGRHLPRRAAIVRSYRELPFSLYHFQTKERDEPRPRAGVLRTREFIMKDAYTFDRDREGLDEHYDQLPRCLRPHLRPLRARVVPRRVRRGDDGRLRRARVHGAVRGGRERRRARARATRPTSRSPAPSAQPVELPEPARRARGVDDARPDDDRRGRVGAATCPAGALLKAYPVMVEDRGLVLVVVRGDHRVNDIKLQNALGATVPRRAREDEFARADRPGGLHRPGRRRRRRSCSTTPSAPGAVRHRRQPRRTRTCAASSPAATSRSSAADVRTVVEPATPSAGTRSGSSRRSRSATSSSSARATPSRSAPPTSTSRARSS